MLYQDQSGRGTLRSKRRLADPQGLLNDRTRNTPIERIRDYAERTTASIQSISASLQELGKNVQRYISRERETQSSSELIKHTERSFREASSKLNRATDSTRRTLQQEDRSLERSNKLGFYLGW